MTTTFTLKNIPAPIYDALKRTAARNRRSINSEILVCLEEAYCSRRASPQDFLAQARKLRESIESRGGPLLSADEIQAAIEHGRR